MCFYLSIPSLIGNEGREEDSKVLQVLDPDM